MGKWADTKFVCFYSVYPSFAEIMTLIVVVVITYMICGTKVSNVTLTAENEQGGLIKPAQ